MKINSITVRRFVASFVSNLKYCNPMGFVMFADENIDIVATQETVSFHETTLLQRYLVQRFRLLHKLQESDQCYLVRCDGKIHKSLLRIEKTPGTFHQPVTFDITFTTRGFNVDDLEFSNYIVYHFTLSEQCISDTKEVHYHHHTGPGATIRVDSRQVYITEISEEILNEIECGLPG